MQQSICDVSPSAESGWGLQLENDVMSFQMLTGEWPFVNGDSEGACFRIPGAFLAAFIVIASPIIFMLGSLLNRYFAC